MNNFVQKSKDDFILSQVLMMTHAATLQRNKVYLDSATEIEKKKLRENLSALLLNLLADYKKDVCEDRHVKNIELIADSLTKQHKDILNNSRFKIGSAQKALNIFLKYMWCLNKTSEPPHCPIDMIILKKVPKFSNTSWTKLDSIQKYVDIIDAIRAMTNNESISQWELRVYAT